MLVLMPKKPLTVESCWQREQKKRETKRTKQLERKRAQRARELLAQLKREGWELDEIVAYVQDEHNHIPWSWGPRPGKPRKLTKRQIEKLKTEIPEYMRDSIGKYDLENITVDDLLPCRKVIATLREGLRKKRCSS
jgi:hypothetical protein